MRGNRWSWLPLVVAATAYAASESLETVEVRGSRAEVRKQIESFVAQVTRKDGELIGQWRDSICPLIAGLSDTQGEFIRSRLEDSRIQASAKEAITAVVVLVDAKKMGKVTLVQTADYLAMVSLSQIDLRADLGATNTILKLFADAQTGMSPPALTYWDYAFLNGLYRSGYYSPMNQRMDISARMSRELAPRE